MTLLALNKRRPQGLTCWHNDFDDMFNSFLKPFEASWATGVAWPVVDVVDTDKAVVVRAEIPGCDPSDIDVNVNGEVLTISGEKKTSVEKKDKDYVHIESSYGSFRRDIHLPADVDPGKIEAVYDKGVLSLTCPKSEKAKPVKIKIKG